MFEEAKEIERSAREREWERPWDRCGCGGEESEDTEDAKELSKHQQAETWRQPLRSGRNFAVLRVYSTPSFLQQIVKPISHLKQCIKATVRSPGALNKVTNFSTL